MKKDKKTSKKTKTPKKDVIFVKQQMVKETEQDKKRKLLKKGLKELEQWKKENAGVRDLEMAPDLETLRTQAIDAMTKCLAILKEDNSSVKEDNEETVINDNPRQKMKVIAVRDGIVSALNEHFEKGWSISHHGCTVQGENTLFFLERN